MTTTTGTSTFGNSSTPSRWYDASPSTTGPMMSMVVNTGRRMQMSQMAIDLTPEGFDPVSRGAATECSQGWSAAKPLAADGTNRERRRFGNVSRGFAALHPWLPSAAPPGLCPITESESNSHPPTAICPLVITFASRFSVPRTSTQSFSRVPSSTSTDFATSPSTTNTFVTPANDTIASGGTVRMSLSVRVRISARAKPPALSTRRTVRNLDLDHERTVRCVHRRVDPRDRAGEDAVRERLDADLDRLAPRARPACTSPAPSTRSFRM